MHRKQWSYGQGRRSSAPKRFSVAVPDSEDKNKNVGEGKKSGIPRPTTVSSRSSSVERDGFQSSSRSTQKFPRSTSVECMTDENPRSEYRSRSTEHAFTPKHLMKTQVCKNTVSVQRTVRKDTRPLTDRAFQMTELAKVEEYLVANEIVQPGPSLSNSMTLKLFVHIMNSLLCKLFPKINLTLSNYCEIIPLFMRKLKYPGNITRSWLVTANSSHTWPNVLGLLSWLVDLINIESTDLKYHEDEGETVLDSEKAKKLFEFLKQRYIQWSGNEPMNTEDDDQFFDDLFVSNKNVLKGKVEKAANEVKDLELRTRETECTDEFDAERKFKIIKADLEKKKSARNALKGKLKNIQAGLEKRKSEMQALLIENADLKQHIAGFDTSNSFNMDDIAKLQSEVVSRRNIIKVRDTQLTNINNQCYTSDLTNARLQGKLDEAKLKREATLRECTSQYINAEKLHLSLVYGNEDNPKILAEYFARVKKTKQHLHNISREYVEKDNSKKAQRNEAEEKKELCKSAIFSKQSELQQPDIKLAEIQKESSDLKSQKSSKEEQHSKLKEKETLLNHHVELLSSSFSDIQEEWKVLDETVKDKEQKYSEILEIMCEALHNHVKKCKEFILKISD